MSGTTTLMNSHLMSKSKQSKTPANFIVGTGRCGSTILSQMIDLHPKVAVLSELFVAMDFFKKYGDRTVAGDELASILDCGLASTGEMKKIAAHLATPEIAFDMASAPITVAPSHYRDGVLPDLILLPLANLFDDPVPVFDELIDYAREQAPRLLSEQYLILFNWMAHRAGKLIWIERSGGTIAHLPELFELFPEGKFLHLHRNPLDACISMQNHNHFRLRTFKHYQLKTNNGISWADLDESDLNNTMPMSEKLRSIFEHPVPLEYFLQDWSDSILRGMAVLKDLSPNQYAEISFEDIMAEPNTALAQISSFFELPAGGNWIEQACGLLNKGQAAHAQANVEQLALLKEYCQSAMVLLGREPAMKIYN